MHRLLFICALWVSLTSVVLGQETDESGFKPLFDGTTLTGWKGEEGWWRVENGVIIAESTPEKRLDHNTFLVWQQGEVDNFELRLKFRISGPPNANSGIQFRGSLREDGHVVGYQADIDRAGQWIGALYDEAARGVFARRGQKAVAAAGAPIATEQVADAAELMKKIDVDDWNEYSITAVGNHITLKVNGQLTAEVIDNDPAGLDRQGLLALQLHTGPPMKIEFRDVRLKRLPMTDGWKKVAFIAGPASHGYFAHEHNAGSKLLADKLTAAAKEHGLPVLAVSYSNGWPKDPTALDNVDCVVSYCDGGPGHTLNKYLEEFDKVVQDRKVGLVCLHYAVETETGNPGQHFLKWMGGYFETNWSVNPHWTANFEKLPNHPITRGVQPFEIRDEWYYHMRFVPEMAGVTPILSALPPSDTLTRRDGPHENNPYVRAAVMERKEPQHTAWAYERPNNGGRGFGFTGGHFHHNWNHDDFRKLVLNAIVWTAGVEVPVGGVISTTPSQAELEANQDENKPANFRFQPPAAAPRAAPPAVNNPAANAQPVRAGSLLAQAAPPPVLPRSDASADAIEQLNIHPDLEIGLFASEPMMTNPSAMEVDHMGRVWVCEAVNYRAFANADVIGRNRDADRILILEDTSGDGKADRSTVFYQGHDVDSAHGILVLPTADGKGTRALVSAGESVFFLIDENGDLKSDRKEVLFTGISGVQHDHGIHAVHFGPDGKFYFNFGNEGKQIKDRTGQPIIDKAGNEVKNSRQPYQEGMVFRCNPDGSDFETLAWNFRNNWELCLDAYGTIWQSDNDDDGNRGVRLNYVMEFGNYGYKDELTGASWQTFRTNMEKEIPQRHWHLNDPGVIPNLILTAAGAPTGIVLYEGALLPAAWRGAVIHADAGTSSVRAYLPRAAGAGYEVDTVSILDGSRNNWFRPSDVAVAPDGTLLVADWYDPGVGGHRMRDAERGRIFRLWRRAQLAPQAPAVDVSTAGGAVAALSSPNMATRYLGWSALETMGPAGRDEVLKLLTAADPRVRARAMWRLVKWPGAGTAARDALRVALADQSPDVRCAAIRGLRQVNDLVPLSEVDDLLNINDPSPQVRRELLIWMRELKQQWVPAVLRENAENITSGMAWARLAQQYDGQDRWYLEALGIAAEGRWSNCFYTWLPKQGKDAWKNSPAARDIIWRSRAPETVKLIHQLLIDPAVPEGEIPRFFRAIDFQQNSERLPTLMALAFEFTGQGRSAGLIRAEALSRLTLAQVRDNAAQMAAVNQIADSARGSGQFVRLVDQFDLRDRFPELLALAQADPTSQLAADAMRVLRTKRQTDLITAALQGDQREKVEATLLALGSVGDRQAVAQLQAQATNAQLPLWNRQAAVRALAASQAGARALLDLARAQYPQELKESLAAALVTSPFEAVRRPALEIFPPPPSRDAAPLPPVSVLAQRTGDAINGRLLFHTTGTCQKCHQLSGIGQVVGPDLSEIGKKLAKPALYESILFPSAAISHNFDSWVIITNEGQIFNGLLVSETAEEMQIKEATGLIRKIPVAGIEERKKQDISLMPSEMQKLLTADELVDLVEYLTTLKEKRQP